MYDKIKALEEEYNSLSITIDKSKKRLKEVSNELELAKTQMSKDTLAGKLEANKSRMNLFYKICDTSTMDEFYDKYSKILPTEKCDVGYKVKLSKDELYKVFNFALEYNLTLATSSNNLFYFIDVKVNYLDYLDVDVHYHQFSRESGKCDIDLFTYKKCLKSTYYSTCQGPSTVIENFGDFCLENSLNVIEMSNKISTNFIHHVNIILIQDI